jgi:DNA-binding transcriptional ArsR family regulator/YHS domain-containing protein
MNLDVFSIQSDLYNALANPKRLEIIHLLRHKELSVTEMIEMLGLSQSNLSQHLTVLRKSNIVATRRDGKNIYYTLSHENIIKASDAIREMLIEQYQGTAVVAELKASTDGLFPLVKDPVCGMRLSPKTASFSLKQGTRVFYFCAEGCLRAFKDTSYRGGVAA